MSTGVGVALAMFTLVVGGLVGLAIGVAIGQTDETAGDSTTAVADLDPDLDIDPDIELARLTEAIEADPQSARAYIDRAEFHSEMWDNEAAIADYGRAIELDPDNDELHIWRGNIYSRTGDAELALDDFDRAIELAPDVAEHRYRRGNELRWLGRTEEAIDNYDAAIERYRLYPEAYRQRASAHVALGDLDAAHDDWTDLIELEPTWYNYESRAWVSVESGNLDAAIDDYSTAMVLPDNSTAHLLTLRGNVHRLSGDDGAALSDYDEAIIVDPDYGPYRQRGQLFVDRGQRDEALADYGLAIDSGDVAAAYLRGRLYLDDGRWSEAEADFTEVLAEFDSGYWYDYSYEFGYHDLSRPALTPRAVLYHRSRARAGGGDTIGSAADLNRYLDEQSHYDEPEVGADAIRTWIAELEAGTNPFAD